jgi:hypothetical protein
MSEHYLVRIYESELALITDETLGHQDLETGGSLFGLFSHGGGPTIFLATRPAGRIRKGNTSLELDPNVTRLLEEIVWKGFGVQCIGLWHSHHWIGLMEPSPGDRERTRRYAQRYDRPQYTEILANFGGDRNGEHWVHLTPFFYLDARELTRAETTFEVLPGTSPLRQALAEYQRDPRLDGALTPPNRVQDGAYRLAGSSGTSVPSRFRRFLSRGSSPDEPEYAEEMADDLRATENDALKPVTEHGGPTAGEAPSAQAEEAAARLQADADAAAQRVHIERETAAERVAIERGGPGPLRDISDLTDYVTQYLQPTMAQLADRDYHVELHMISDSRVAVTISRRGSRGQVLLLAGWDGRDAVSYGCKVLAHPDRLVDEWPIERPNQTFAIKGPLEWGLSRLAQLR